MVDRAEAGYFFRRLLQDELCWQTATASTLGKSVFLSTFNSGGGSQKQLYLNAHTLTSYKSFSSGNICLLRDAVANQSAVNLC